jgi:hypothetical protein
LINSRNMVQFEVVVPRLARNEVSALTRLGPLVSPFLGLWFLVHFERDDARDSSVDPSLGGHRRAQGVMQLTL